MFFYEGEQCPVCGQRFHEEEDIVSCPACGTPHHRACWQASGDCCNQERHGEGFLWVPGKTAAAEEAAPAGMPADGVSPGGAPPAGAPSVFPPPAQPLCPRCGHPNSPFAEMCGRCGLPLHAPDWSAPSMPHGSGAPGMPPPPGYYEYTPFHRRPDPYGGVGADELIGDATARDLASVVGVNTAYYLPRFRRLHGQRLALSWNWPAFLLAPFWLLYRKQYVAGGIVLALTTVLSLMSNYLITMRLPNEYLTPDNVQVLTRDPVLLIVLGTELFLRLVIGLMGNYLYLQICQIRVRRAKRQQPAAYQTLLRRMGGISFIMAVLAYVLLQVMNQLMLMYYIPI